VVGTDTKKILVAMKKTLEEQVELPTLSPFGSGTTAQAIVEIIKKNFPYEM
jgi:UDP-N-acetylglucosamine 2-epimerase